MVSPVSKSRSYKTGQLDFETKGKLIGLLVQKYAHHSRNQKDVLTLMSNFCGSFNRQLRTRYKANTVETAAGESGIVMTGSSGIPFVKKESHEASHQPTTEKSETDERVMRLGMDLLRKYIKYITALNGKNECMNSLTSLTAASSEIVRRYEALISECDDKISLATYKQRLLLYGVEGRDRDVWKAPSSSNGYLSLLNVISPALVSQALDSWLVSIEDEQVHIWLRQQLSITPFDWDEFMVACICHDSVSNDADEANEATSKSNSNISGQKMSKSRRSLFTDFIVNHLEKIFERDKEYLREEHVSVTNMKTEVDEKRKLLSEKVEGISGMHTIIKGMVEEIQRAESKLKLQKN